MALSLQGKGGLLRPPFFATDPGVCSLSLDELDRHSLKGDGGERGGERVKKQRKAITLPLTPSHKGRGS